MKYLFLFFLFLQNIIAEDFFQYQVISGDTLSKISKEHLSDPRKWRELLKYNQIESPNLIKPGLALKIPDFLSKSKKQESKIEAPIAKVISKVGSLKLKKKGYEEWNDINVDKDLVINDIVRTSESSSAEIDFFETPRTIILLREQYQISSDDNISRYGCYAGMIEVSAQNQTVKVPAGYGTVVIKGQPPMKPFKLLEKVKIRPIIKDTN